MIARILLGGLVIVLSVVGVVAVVKPEWAAIADRRHKAAGTSSRPDQAELTETYYLVVRIVGVGFIITAFVYGIQLL